jgi:hypothetical protein
MENNPMNDSIPAHVKALAFDGAYCLEKATTIAPPKVQHGYGR